MIISSTQSSSKLSFLNSRKSDVLRLFGNNQKLKNLYGLTPQTDLENGLKQTIDWFKSLLAQKSINLEHIHYNPLSEESWLKDLS